MENLNARECVYARSDVENIESHDLYASASTCGKKVFSPPEVVFRACCKMVCIGFCKLGVAGELKIRGGQVPLEIPKSHKTFMLFFCDFTRPHKIGFPVVFHDVRTTVKIQPTEFCPESRQSARRSGAYNCPLAIWYSRSIFGPYTSCWHADPE